MKIKVLLFIAMSFFVGIVSCDNTKPQKAHELDMTMRNQTMSLLQNNLSLFLSAGNSQPMGGGGGPMGFWFYPPWMYYGVSAGVTESAVPIFLDSSYYDASTGYWVYQYRDSTFFSQWRYKFLPHDNDGYPTTETDQYLFDATYSGRYEDNLFGIKYSYSGESDFGISGLKDWMDTLKTGTMVFSGTSHSNSSQDFSVDTSVNYSYNEVIDRITMHEGDCSPRSGSMNFEIVQDATPDTFTYVYEFEANSNEWIYKDSQYTGSIVFTENGVQVIIDGEDYSYDVDCADSGIVTMGRAAKLVPRR